MDTSDNFIKGLVFSVFDDFIGPKPQIYEPNDLPRALLQQIAGSTLAFEVTKEKTITQLSILPFPTYSYKILYKNLHFDSQSVRGKIGLGSLSLIFKEENDVIFYKYIKQFEQVFDHFGLHLIELEERTAPDDEYEEWIKNLKDELNFLIKSLRKKELESRATEDTEAFYVYKLIICGDGNVGKTSIVLQFTKKAFKTDYLATIGVNISNKRVYLEDINQNIMVNLWDIAGQTKFTHFHQIYYSGAAGFILVVDLTDRNSLDSITNWYNEIHKANSKIPGILVGNKKDLVDTRTVSHEELSELGEKLGLEIIEVSAKTGENIKELFNAFSQSLYLLSNKPLKPLA